MIAKSPFAIIEKARITWAETLLLKYIYKRFPATLPIPWLVPSNPKALSSLLNCFFIITEDEVNEIVNAKPKAIEKLLYRLYNFIVKHDKNSISLAKMNAINDSQELNLVKNEISSINKEYEELLKRKDFLENQISVFEEGNKALQEKIEQLKSSK